MVAVCGCDRERVLRGDLLYLFPLPILLYSRIGGELISFSPRGEIPGTVRFELSPGDAPSVICQTESVSHPIATART